jgi:hypothetical protein
MRRLSLCDALRVSAYLAVSAVIGSQLIAALL